MGRISPCYTCTKHTAICHAQCEEYHAWAAERRGLREAHKEKSRGGREADTMLIDKRIKLRKRKERRP